MLCQCVRCLYLDCASVFTCVRRWVFVGICLCVYPCHAHACVLRVLCTGTAHVHTERVLERACCCRQSVPVPTVRVLESACSFKNAHARTRCYKLCACAYCACARARVLLSTETENCACAQLAFARVCVRACYYIIKKGEEIMRACVLCVCSCKRALLLGPCV